ncbi:MAG: hypothetical protein MUC83_03480 [Pirellula sp.]|jgi:uncharacterized BrkB/YihY/UPF0761 family membrane protein|nr:hypothetical protein [Pirellula sp.]
MKESTNPYSSKMDNAWKEKPGFSRKIVYRFLTGMLYAVVLLLGGTLLIGFASGILFTIVSASKIEPSDQQLEWIGMLWIVIPFATGAAGFVLGVLGFSPSAWSRMLEHRSQNKR